ncbi:hypothetical protein BZZ01_22720 [Nostocales cyanobacterium HT-58-2]|nr:hypothetical protein BZZ01_22720 [Nostocales cyanobacterium HT-58-2]
MANSPLVSIRIPPETLKRVDGLAQKLYPARRVGKNPNRSQVILDAIAQFLEQHESSCTSTLEIDEQLDEQPIKALDTQRDNESINNEPQQYPNNLEPPIREYIDWWFDYFSYMKKFTNIWFGANPLVLLSSEQNLKSLPEKTRTSSIDNEINYRVTNSNPELKRLPSNRQIFSAESDS